MKKLSVVGISVATLIYLMSGHMSNEIFDNAKPKKKRNTEINFSAFPTSFLFINFGCGKPNFPEDVYSSARIADFIQPYNFLRTLVKFAFFLFLYIIQLIACSLARWMMLTKTR